MTDSQHADDTAPDGAQDGPGDHRERVRDVVVIGGGPAGLQAALTVARVHRDVLLLDAGEGRNAPASHMHNLVTRDGTPPSEFRRMAVEEIASYPTAEVRQARVRRVGPVPEEREDGDGTAYLVELEDGSRVAARRLILATGVRDELPEVPGLPELWGELAVQCPFCHGHEFAGQRVAVLGADQAAHVAGIMRPVAEEVVVLTHGEELDAPVGGTVRTERVRGMERHGDGVRVHLDGGEPVDVAGVFVGTTMVQAAPFAEQLGIECNPSTCVRVDEHARTSLPGVYAAGDMAHLAALPTPVPTVAQALASGAIAGGSAVADGVEA